jgi:regulator of sirC expression with transglutaminase-like and TPR domain
VDVAGVGLPRHFIVAHRPGEEGERLIDVFDDAAVIDRRRAGELSGVELGDEDFAPATRRSILARMLRNLLNVAEGEGDRDGMSRYLDAILTVEPDSAEDRWRRAQLRFQAGDLAGLSEDVDWLLAHEPPGIDLERLRELREFLRRRTTTER